MTSHVGTTSTVKSLDMTARTSKALSPNFLTDGSIAEHSRQRWLADLPALRCAVHKAQRVWFGSGNVEADSRAIPPFTRLSHLSSYAGLIITSMSPARRRHALPETAKRYASHLRQRLVNEPCPVRQWLGNKLFYPLSGRTVHVDLFSDNSRTMSRVLIIPAGPSTATLAPGEAAS